MLLKSILNRFSKSVCLSSGKNSNLLQAYKPQTSVVLKSNISYLLNSNISLNSNVLNLTSAHSVLYKDQNYFSISSTKNDLMQFFDEKKNWTEEKVKHGRPWRLEELRIKSNTDLHKLWYVLHKERNMLLTMEEVYKQKGVPMPSHERIAKVDESMENLLSVVEERNIAFNLLETGETKKVLPYRRYNSFGHIQYYRPREYLVPWYLNKMWKLKYHYKKIPYWSKFYTSLNRVRLRKERGKIVRQVNYATRKVMSKHPELESDKEFLREHYEKKYGYKPPMPYHELIRRPAPNELPKDLRERMRSKSSSQFKNDDF